MKRKQYLAGLISLLVFVVPAAAAASVQPYGVSSAVVQPGMILSQSANAGVAELATTSNASLLVGVVSGDTSLTTPAGQVNVISDETATTLVSTINGDIKVGDRLSPSSLAGIGAKNLSNGWLIGVAQASFDKKSNGAVETAVTDSSGGKHTVYVGRIPVALHITYYAKPAAQPSDSYVPTPIQNVADKLAGKRVSLLGLVLSFVLLITGIFWAGQLLYASIKGGLDAMARQPLAKTVINRAMIQSLIVSSAIVIGVLFGAFLLLRLL